MVFFRFSVIGEIDLSFFERQPIALGFYISDWKNATEQMQFMNTRTKSTENEIINLQTAKKKSSVNERKKWIFHQKIDISFLIAKSKRDARQRACSESCIIS